jgi:hypothetical protein
MLTNKGGTSYFIQVTTIDRSAKTRKTMDSICNLGGEKSNGYKLW